MQDQRIEHWLITEGVAFTYEPALPISDIDVEASKRNQARVNTPLIDDLIERYTLALIDGAEFPALLAHRRGTNKLVLLDGNQRLAACIDAERQAVDAYIVADLDDMQATALCWTANVLNGDAGTPLDRHLQAKAFHLRWPHIPRVEVARRFRIDAGKFERDLRVDAVSVKLSELGLDAEAMSHTNKDRLHVYMDNDVQFREAAKFIQEANLRGELANEFWADVRRGRSEAEVLAVIERWRERPDVQARLRQVRYDRPSIPKSKMQQALDKLNALLRHLERYPDPTALGVVGREEVATLAERTKLLGQRVAALVRATNTADGQGRAA